MIQHKTTNIVAETIPVTTIIDKDSECEANDLTGLLSVLEGSFEEKLKSFEIRQPLGEIKDFGESLARLGKDHCCRIITEYGLELADAAENFNIELMLKLLRKYHENIEMLKS